MISYYNTIDEINTDTVIIPIGSIEQHGSHLPTGTDYIRIKHISEKIAEKINAYLLPPLPVSNCYEHKGKKGSVRMRPSTFMLMLTDIITDLKEQGFKRVILLMGHGGVFAAGPVVRELNSLNDDLKVIKVEGIRSAQIAELFEGDYSNELHAGEKETSEMLAICEESVKQDKMKENDFVPDVPREYLNYSSLLKLSPTGVWGYPSYSTKEKGAKLIELYVEEAVRYIEDAFEHTENGKW